jgi:hypothetical protein
MNDIARIEVLEARARITDVVYGYAQGVRTGNFANCISLFTVNATFEVREAVPSETDSVRTRATLKGRGDILQYLNQAAATSGGVCPLISNLIVNVQGRQATSNCVMAATVWASGKIVMGEYHDSFQHDDEWRFTSRIYTIFRARS